MALRREQKSALAQIAIANTASLAFIAGAFVLVPFDSSSLESAADRIAFTLRWEALAALTLGFGVSRVSLFRMFSARAIDGSAPTADERGLELGRRYLQNTLEQLVLAVIAHLALATWLAPDAMRLIPILVTWFVIARIAFFVGYQRNPTARILGFAATSLPTLVVLIYDVARLVW